MAIRIVMCFSAAQSYVTSGFLSGIKNSEKRISRENS